MTEQRPGEALGRGLGELLKGSGKGRPVSYTPIMKSLEHLGILPRIMTVTIGDEPVDCLVIPSQELLIKEYAAITGVDPNVLLNVSPPSYGGAPEEVPSEEAPEEPKPPRKRAPAKKTIRKAPENP